MELLGRKRKEHVRIFVVSTVTLFLALFIICSRSIDSIHTFIKRCGTPGEILAAALFVVLYVFLWFSYRRWRTVLLTRDELDDILSAIRPHAVMLVDRDGTVLACAEHIKSLFGRTAQDTVGKKVDFLYAGSGPEPQTPLDMGEILDAKQPYVGRATGKTQDGRTLPLEISANGVPERNAAVLLIRHLDEGKETAGEANGSGT